MQSYKRKDGSKQFTFTPTVKNRKWLDKNKKKNGTPISVQLNNLIEKAILEGEKS